MSTSRILSRVINTLVFAILGASVGVCYQASRITGKPQEFRSLAKLVASGGKAEEDIHMRWRESQMDFYGTIIETIESAEMKRRALERVRALNPDLKDNDVDIRVTQTKGSSIFNILATGTEPEYTRIFLDALLDEFMSFRQQIRESQGGKTLQQFLQEVAARQKIMEEALVRMEQARSKVESLSAKADQERLVTRLTKLRDQRDGLRLELKPLAANDAARASLETKMASIEQEISMVEAELGRYEPDIAELRTAAERYAVDKEAYQKLFEKLDGLQAQLNSSTDYVAIQERATLASEHVEDWKLPIAVGATGGGLLGGFVGFLLSLIFVRSPKPSQIPAAL
ncbi:MAG TPA: hypothetical protein DDZ88_21970 [Verrucomicrobiales bacterium]|nr:hypothetical protein [Verrucomicrobiales bacterium]